MLYCMESLGRSYVEEDETYVLFQKVLIDYLPFANDNAELKVNDLHTKYFLALEELYSMSKSKDASDMNSEEKMADIRSEHKHSLILIAVNQGYTEQVMQTARTAGATGGTVIRARLSDANQSEEFYGIALQAEKEIIAIMASDTVRNAIMDAVNAEHGMRSEAQAAICSLPVDRAFKI